MSRLLKLKRQVIAEANKRVLNEQYTDIDYRLRMKMNNQDPQMIHNGKRISTKDNTTMGDGFDYGNIVVDVDPKYKEEIQPTDTVQLLYIIKAPDVIKHLEELGFKLNSNILTIDLKPEPLYNDSRFDFGGNPPEWTGRIGDNSVGIRFV